MGSDEPRTQGKFGILPGARVVSNKVHTKSTAADLDPPLSYFTKQFGQFLDHDITKTALAKGLLPYFKHAIPATKHFSRVSINI